MARGTPTPAEVRGRVSVCITPRPCFYPPNMEGKYRIRLVIFCRLAKYFGFCRKFTDRRGGRASPSGPGSSRFAPRGYASALRVTIPDANRRAADGGRFGRTKSSRTTPPKDARATSKGGEEGAGRQGAIRHILPPRSGTVRYSVCPWPGSDLAETSIAKKPAFHLVVGIRRNR